MRASRRRQLARDAALRVLTRGEIGPEAIALRHVAQEMDVPLSTLTYAYPSTGPLLEDLVEEYNSALWGDMTDHVGSAGLRVELERAARRLAIDVLADPGRRALILWQVQALARSEWTRSEVSLERATRLIDTIADRAGEHYRVPHQVLAHLILAYTYGVVVQWLATSDEQAYWSTALAGVDGAVLLADPRPADDAHAVPAPRDYASVTVPRSREGRAPRTTKPRTARADPASSPTPSTPGGPGQPA